MEKIHSIRPLGTQLPIDLVRNPGCTIADDMELTRRAKPGLRRTTSPWSPAFLNPTRKIPPQQRGDTPFRMDEIQAHFFPTQYFTLALVFGLCGRFDDRDPGAIPLANKNTLRCRPRFDHARGCLRINTSRMMFRGPLNRTDRHFNAVMFLELGRDPPNGMIRPKIRHHPLSGP
jgi:hypothetical protein